MIIAYVLSFYNPVLRLNELITQVATDKHIREKIITNSCKNAVFDFLYFINLGR